MRFILVFLFLTVFSVSHAQEEPAVIRVKKESNLSKAVLDNTEGRLMVVDRFGNPRENRIASYRLYVKNGKETREFRGYGNKLSKEMLDYLNKQPRAVKIFFTEVQAIDEGEHLVKLPDVIETWFPDCSNCEPRKRR